MKRQGPQICLIYDEEKGMICEWCVENKQTLVAQNVLNSKRVVKGIFVTRDRPYFSCEM